MKHEYEQINRQDCTNVALDKLFELLLHITITCGNTYQRELVFSRSETYQAKVNDKETQEVDP